MIDDSVLHSVARIASIGRDIDKKQLRFNEIVATAKLFYPNDPVEGVKELVESCDRTSPLYVAGDAMHLTLQRDYKWLLG